MHSLRSRLVVLWAISLVACLAVGALLVQLYRQSTEALLARAGAEMPRACDLIRDRYSFYTAGWQGPVPALTDPGLRRDLTAAVALALARQDGIEGGIWQAEAGPLAYAYPTYQGSGPKTDLPQAERARIRAVNEESAREEQPAAQRVDTRSQTLLLYACPLGGPIPGLTAWTMTRVQTAPGSRSLQLGLGILLALMLTMSAWLTRLMLVWTGHVRRIERALAGQDGAVLPALARTGERELDRVIDALNDASARLTAARREADALAAQVAAAERLAALGRIAAGVAHEIRNPIAAMRLRAESGLAGDDVRRRKALAEVLHQIARLDRLVAELLAMTQRREPRPVTVDLPGFLADQIEAYAAEAAARGIAVRSACAIDRARFDPELVGRILGNLLANAMRHTPDGGQVSLTAAAGENGLRFTVADTGPGVAPALRERLFEPFVTGRADGTGLGLAIARELGEAQGGHVVLLDPGGATQGQGAVFALELPEAPACRRS
ncbi:MAG TPA: HAMP domain-containing sensor histidine kinase [Stellaceae bacterium]|nr:HAMP domain-containing sensor histidine kinase [Stellaceae bacterium]